MSTARLGDDCHVDAGATVGYEHPDYPEPTVLGDGATVREGTIIYTGVEAGENLTTGHNALVREATTLGDDVLVGTDTVIDGAVEIGSDVSLQTGVYVPRETTVGSNVFVGPKATLTNDPYPVRQEADLQGPTIEDGASVGANATLLPGVTVGEGAFVAAGSVVTEDVPPETLAMGTPAEHADLPESLTGVNALA